METFTEDQRISSQKINMDKSEMAFSKGLITRVKAEFYSQMHIKIVNQITKYLGMLTQLGRSKVQDFNFFMERIWSNLKGLKEKNLSFARRGGEFSLEL